MFLVRKATTDDAVAVRNFVMQSGLDVDGLPDIESFLIAESEKKDLLGVIGLETIGTSGLLRALVLNRSESTSERLLQFFDQVLLYAKKANLDELFLTSKEESFFFQVFGFSTISFEEVPKKVREHELFSNQSDQRVIMRKRLN
ncbi:GNAT family N-acetyltransferase [Pseudalkalibacillus hwajinpoensis]|uniref:GNAT family N-acetyltransferase n=1 Tax=Guptibacillus hwajinpoensis TaxID=208199 RepID=UPI001CD7E306|nr:hypothetical protein [Pseudalkalibacillus hwajinpoensis]MCA0991212.1 hypothetical protein [Pseudalkalibacillus hwajinpoensis]